MTEQQVLMAAQLQQLQDMQQLANDVVKPNIVPGIAKNKPWSNINKIKLFFLKPKLRIIPNSYVLSSTFPDIKEYTNKTHNIHKKTIIPIKISCKNNLATSIVAIIVYIGA